MAHKKPIHLYPYQADMVNRIEKAFRSVMVQMPPGTGKPHVIAVIARKFVSEGKTEVNPESFLSNFRGLLCLIENKRNMDMQNG